MANITQLQDVQQSDLSTSSVPVVRISQKVSDSDTTINLNTSILDENGASITKAFIGGIRKANGYVEKIYVPAGGVSGTQLTGVTRGLEQGGLDFTTSVSANATSHEVGEEFFISVSGQILQQALEVLLGRIKTGAKNMNIGDGTTDATQGFTIDQGLLSSTTKYGADASGNPLITIPDGTSFVPGPGVGTIVGGDGITITGGTIDVDTTDTVTFKAVSAGVADAGKAVLFDADGYVDQDSVQLIKDVTSTAAELNKLDGTDATVNTANLNALTDESNVDDLHTHDDFTLRSKSGYGLVLFNTPDFANNGLSSLSNNSSHVFLREAGIAANGTAYLTYAFGSGNYSGVRYLQSLMATSINDAGDRFFSGLIAGTSISFNVSYDSNTGHLGFVFSNGAMYATSADGVSQTKTLISGVTPVQGEMNTVSIDYDGTTALFYVDGVLKATHTTNLPLISQIQQIGASINSNTATNTDLVVTYPEIYIK